MSKERRDSIIAKKQGGSSPGITSGVSWDAFDVDGYPTKAVVYGFIMEYQFGELSFPLLILECDNSVTIIPDDCCYGANLLETVVLSSNLIAINRRAFKGCGAITIDSLPLTLEHIGTQAFANCTSLARMWIPISCGTIVGSDFAESPFMGCDSGLTIYCEAESKPAGWGDYWNYYDNTNQLTVVWGVSKAEFDALE